MCRWQSLCLSTFIECLPKRPRILLLLEPSPAGFDRGSGERYNDLLVYFATFAIKYKYAIKQNDDRPNICITVYPPRSNCRSVEIFARKRRHKLRNMAHLARQKTNGTRWQRGTRTEAKTKAFLNGSSSQPASPPAEDMPTHDLLRGYNGAYTYRIVVLNCALSWRTS